jgi:flagellar hook-associated protein 1 FlgK
MFGKSIGILYSALWSDNTALTIHNRNVANANNPNYVREREVLQNFPAMGGVDVADIDRISDEILFQQKISSKGKFAGYDEEYLRLNDIFTYFDETQGGGLSKFIDNVYKTALQFSRDPENEGAKRALLTHANALVNRIKELYNVSVQYQNKLKKEISKDVEQINRLVRELGKVNKEIAFAYAKNKSQSNDYKYLLDKRDELLSRLSEYVPLEIQTDKIGRATIAVKNGSATASGYITLVYNNGEINELTYDGSNLEIYDSQGIKWESSNHRFFTEGKLGAKFNTYYKLDNYKSQLDTLAEMLANNSNLSGANNGSGKAIFSGTTVADLTVNITKTDLDSYDTTKASDDQDNLKIYWDTVKETYNDFSSQISDDLTDIKIKRDTERDIMENLETKYNEKTGVNLDQELAEIMKLQQHYQAVSKMLATSTRLLDYILNAVR